MMWSGEGVEADPVRSWMICMVLVSCSRRYRGVGTDVGDSTEMDGTAEYDSDSCRLYRIPISSDSPPSSGRIVVIARDVPTIDPARDVPSQLWTLGR